jgi:hypothetical protein
MGYIELGEKLIKIEKLPENINIFLDKNND